MMPGHERGGILRTFTMHSTTPLERARIFRNAAAFAAAGIFATISLNAQTTAGLIGVRHAEASVFFESIDEDGIDDGLGVAFRANIPLHAAIDLSIAGSHEEIDTNEFRERTAFATITAHWAARDLTPYLAGSVGQVWQSVVVDDVKYSEDESVYAIAAGVEAPIADRTALNARVSYTKYFDSELGHYWTYSAGFNHWFSDSLGATATVSFRDSDSIIYSLGALLRF